MAKRKVPTPELQLIRSGPEKDAPFTVHVPCVGVPDFHVRAKSGREAKRLLAEYIYNELDGREGLDADGVPF